MVLIDLLAAFVSKAYAMSPHSPDGSFHEGINDIQHIVNSLHDATCTLKHEESCTTAGAGGENYSGDIIIRPLQIGEVSLVPIVPVLGGD